MKFEDARKFRRYVYRMVWDKSWAQQFQSAIAGYEPQRAER